MVMEVAKWDVETELTEGAVSEIEDPALVGEFDTSTESADVEAQVAMRPRFLKLKIRLWLESSIRPQRARM